MAGFQSTIKLGRPREELQFTAAVEAPESIGINHGWLASRTQNVAGETFLRVRRRYDSQLSLRIDAASEALVQQLESLRFIADTNLALIWANARAVYSERIALDTTTELTLPSNPMTLLGRDYVAAGGSDSDIIGIAGVFAAYSPNGTQGGTNYFSGGGAYDAASRKVTLGSSPGAAGTFVYVNWTYNGTLVAIKDLKTGHKGGEFNGQPLWDVSISLEGI